jgi:hypothetical protein
MLIDRSDLSEMRGAFFCKLVMAVDEPVKGRWGSLAW